MTLKLISYKSTKLLTKFPIKDKQIFNINITCLLMKDARMAMLERQKGTF